MKLKRIFLLIVVVCFLLAGVFAWQLLKPLPITKQIDIQIPTRTTISKATDILAEKKAISSPFIFKWSAKIYATLYGKGLYAGYYRFSAHQSHWQLLRSIFSGKQSFTVNVVFPEGISLTKFASIAAKQVGIDSTEFMKLATSDSLLRARNIKGKSVEGFIMPDTYNFFWKQPVGEVLDKLLDEQDRIWTDKFAALAKKADKTRREILTLASIVESETPQPDERSRIAGVYINRISKNMKLEADPTVQYALGEQRHLLYRDLEIDSPYNTYKYEGLPPGPINSPGIASIEAALEPEKHDYIYFVATGDGDHTFSKTYTQHLKAVELYRLKRKK
ncbi:MAG: endolytic transglycosylase MltG [Bacteroidetes bacterium]|nr:endolytic transglycosylase MltG [Bacteroidota bacterium]